MSHEQWRAFYDRESGDVYDGWGNQLVPHFTRLGITCGIVFRYHHTRKIRSRKKNCNLFSGIGRCTAEMCPVKVRVEFENKPKKKDQPYLFKVVIKGDKDHDPKQESFSRPVNGAVREAMGML